jgi:hypothetical protein
MDSDFKRRRAGRKLKSELLVRQGKETYLDRLPFCFSRPVVNALISEPSQRRDEQGIHLVKESNANADVSLHLLLFQLSSHPILHDDIRRVLQCITKISVL